MKGESCVKDNISEAEGGLVLTGGENRKEKSIYTQIARKALENKVNKDAPPEPFEDLPPELQKPGAAFVSLKKDGQLRGCIGTVSPTQKNLAEEIAVNAVNAGLSDPRFSPVTPSELEHLTYSVDVLTEPEKVDDSSQLDPREYGVIVRRGRRAGLLLPALEGVNTVEEQLHIAKQKAGLGPDEPVEIYRFRVERYQ